ncbi:MAG: hypothetical protein IKV94_04395 [Clostridia bacterium]|nr:hypothetical protein [Clostridia bacterium]
MNSKFYKNIKLIVNLLFMVAVAMNIIMYFFIQDSVVIYNREINTMYIIIGFVLLEVIILSTVYGKKQGLMSCLIFTLVVFFNFFFLINTLI